MILKSKLRESGEWLEVDPGVRIFINKRTGQRKMGCGSCDYAYDDDDDVLLLQHYDALGYDYEFRGWD